MADKWYVLACTPRKERVMYHQLSDRGFEVFYAYLIVRTTNPNTLKIEPYFPGYLFIKVDLTKVALSTFQWMPMTSGLVCVAGNPAYVPDVIIKAIHRSVRKINSMVLGMMDDLDQTEVVEGDESAVAADRVLLDEKLSGPDRAQALLQLLQEVSLAP